MGDGRDPFTILSSANPVDVDRLEVTNRSASREVLEKTVAALHRRPGLRVLRFVPRPRLRRLRLVAVVVVALATLSWSLIIAARPPTKPLVVACYETPDLEARTELVSNRDRPPAEICAEVWRAGVFGSGPVPPLVACVLQSGAIGVIPGEDQSACARLQAGPLASTGPGAGAQDPIASTDALKRTFAAEACIDETRARQLVKGELDDRGLAGWTVEVASEFTDVRPCATLGIDVPSKRVLLIPAPPRR